MIVFKKLIVYEDDSLRKICKSKHKERINNSSLAFSGTLVQRSKEREKKCKISLSTNDERRATKRKNKSDGFCLYKSKLPVKVNTKRELTTLL